MYNYEGKKSNELRYEANKKKRNRTLAKIQKLSRKKNRSN
jgi:hypothetical protein